MCFQLLIKFLSSAIFREHIVQLPRESRHYSLRIIKYNCRPERDSTRKERDV